MIQKYVSVGDEAAEDRDSERGLCIACTRILL